MAESEFVYHYCTVETMKDIFEQGTLRLSDIEKSMIMRNESGFRI